MIDSVLKQPTQKTVQLTDYQTTNSPAALPGNRATSGAASELADRATDAPVI